jgi:putative endonuclease
MACYVYVLGSEGGGKCGDYRTYVGWTTDLAARLEKHNSGSGARATRGRNWQLLYAERYLNRGEAMSREWHIKRDRNFRGCLRANWRG